MQARVGVHSSHKMTQSFADTQQKTFAVASKNNLCLQLAEKAGEKIT